MLRLALPVLIEQLLAMLIGFSDAALAGHYLDQPHLAAMSLLVYILLVMLSSIGIACLRGAGDTRWPLVFSLIGFLVVRIPAAYWLAFPVLRLPGTGWTLAGWGLGVQGAWYAMAADLAVRAGLVSWRFRHGGWKRVEV